MAELLSLLAFWQAKILPPSDPGTYIDIGLRWIHFVAGITWIGLLYFFNLVNVPFMKAIDAPTKGKVVPALLPKALWYFRWGAVFTVLAGLAYWIILQHREPQPPDGSPGDYLLRTLGIWLGLWIVLWAIEFFLIQAPPVAKNGNILAVIMIVLVVLVGYFYVNQTTFPGASNRVISIGVGGGMGLVMLLNVWGIIWPAQKRIIRWTKENAEKGTPIPPESAVLARRAFLASRTNAWLSLPMLFMMAAASHFPIFVGG